MTQKDIETFYTFACRRDLTPEVISKISAIFGEFGETLWAINCNGPLDRQARIDLAVNTFEGESFNIKELAERLVFLGLLNDRKSLVKNLARPIRQMVAARELDVVKHGGPNCAGEFQKLSRVEATE